MTVGIRVGIIPGMFAGTAVGISASEVGNDTSPYDLVAVWEGQSNCIGQADAGATKSDSSYNHFTAFTGANMIVHYSTAPSVNTSTPQTYIDLANQPLKTYANAGSSNYGPWLQYAKFLVKYGGYKKVLVIVIAVSGSSLRRHRGVNANYPSVGPIWTSFESTVTAAESAGLRKVDIFHTVELETDAGDATDTAQAQTNMALMRDTMRTNHNPNMFYVVNQLNAATTSGPNQAAIRAAQQAVVVPTTGDPLSKSALVNNDRFPLDGNDPHYGPATNDIGDENGFVALSLLQPGRNLNLGSGPAPWVQYFATGVTAIATPNTASPRSGAQASDGDWEYLVARSYSAATTHTLTTAAGFTLVGSVTSTFSGTIINTVTVWERPVTTAILLANSGRMPAPVIDFGVADKNVSRIVLVRGPNKWTVSPTAGFATGANNANTTALSIPGLAGGTTTTNNLVLMFLCTAGGANGVASITGGTGSTGAAVQANSDGKYNPGNGTIGLAIASMTVPTVTTIGNTSVTFLSTGVNAGIAVYIKP